MLDGRRLKLGGASLAASGAPWSTTSTKPLPPCSVRSSPRPASSLLARGGGRRDAHELDGLRAARADVDAVESTLARRSPPCPRADRPARSAARRRPRSPGRPRWRRSTAEPATSRPLSASKIATSQSPARGVQPRGDRARGRHGHGAPVRLRTRSRASLRSSCGRPRTAAVTGFESSPAALAVPAWSRQPRTERARIRRTSRMLLAFSASDRKLRPAPPATGVSKRGVPDAFMKGLTLLPNNGANSSRPGTPGVRHPVHELRGRGDHARADARAEVALHPLRDASAERRSRSKRSRSRPSARRAPRGAGWSRCAWSSSSESCISQKRPWQRGRLGGAGEHPGARVLGGHREVPEHPPDRQLLQDQVRPGAVRALEVRVLEHHRAVAAHVVVGPGLRRRAAGPARRRSGSRRDLERRGRHVRPVDRALGADHHERALAVRRAPRCTRRSRGPPRPWGGSRPAAGSRCRGGPGTPCGRTPSPPRCRRASRPAPPARRRTSW